MTTLSDLIARLRVNADLPDDIVMVVPPPRLGETYQQLAKRCILVINIATLKPRHARR